MSAHGNPNTHPILTVPTAQPEPLYFDQTANLSNTPSGTKLLSSITSLSELEKETIERPPPAQPWWKGCTNPWAQLVIYSLACLLTSCIYFGWQDYKRMVLRSGAYSWYCTGEDPDSEDGMEGACKAQSDAVNRLYAYSNGSEFAFAAVAGLLLDTIGPRYTAIIGELIHFLSTLLLIFSKESAQMYVPALFFAGACVNLISFPALTLKQNWLTRQALCVSIIVGCQSAASLVAPLLRVMWDKNPHWSFRQLWGVWLAAVWLPITILYIWALPTSRPVVIKTKLGTKDTWKAFWKDARTLDLILMGIYFTLQMFQFAYFPDVSSEVFGEAVSTFQGWVTPIQGPGSMIIGFFMDYTGTILVMYIMCFTLIFVDLSAAFGAKNAGLMKGVSFWFIFIQSATYNLKYTFVNEMYDPFNFGKLVGLLGLCSGIGVYLSAPLVSAHDYTIVFGSLAAVAVVMTGFTTFLFWRQASGVTYKTIEAKEIDAHRISCLKRRKRSEHSLATTAVSMSLKGERNQDVELGLSSEMPKSPIH